jgi:heptosyltransferase-1
MISSILIIKTSSLGDIIQSFHVLNFLKKHFPKVEIDWVVEKKFLSLVAAHPLVRHAKPIDRKQMFSSLREIRKISYDVIFDLQGNSKSALVTLFSRGKIKVGFGVRSVREWPNLFATQIHFNVVRQMNVRLQYLSLIAQFFQLPLSFQEEKVLLKTTDIGEIYREGRKNYQIMVCPGSHWVNKQLPLEIMIPFLSLIQKKYGAFFLLMWGTASERDVCEKIRSVFLEHSQIIEKLPFPVWQNLMSCMDLVIAVDSSALHLCGTTSTPSFSIFGPTSSSIFKPLGNRHFSFQGTCPYGRTFEKQCPILRTCPTGSCIKQIDPKDLFASFVSWWSLL